ncbi:hypothetical protein BDV12DRAFT_198697 [Aspergillus spectabilis]
MAAQAMHPLTDAGLNYFDMADIYGDAGVAGDGQVAGDISQEHTAFTKRCPPENGYTSWEQAEKAIDRALQRMGQSQITLLQYHIWDYSDDTYWHNLVYLQRLKI